MRINHALTVWVIASLCWISGCSQTVEDQLKQAQNDLRIGKFDRAQKVIDDIAAADSTSPETVYGKGLLDEYQALEWEALLKHLEAAKMGGGYAPAMDAFTRLAIKLEYFENARRMARIYINQQPDNPAGYQYMAALSIRENQLDSARVYLAQAETRTKDSRDIVLTEAEIAFHSYDEETIRAALAKLSQTRFETTGQFQRLASLYHYLNMSDSALFYSRQAVEKDPADLGGRLQLAQYLFDEMRLEEAYKVVSGLTSDAEEYGGAWILSAYIKWALGDKGSAEKDFYKYLGDHDLSPIPLEKHGDFYTYFDEKISSVTDFEAAFVMAANLRMPDDYIFGLYLKLMNGLLDNRDFAMAVEFYEEGARIKPGTFEVSFIEAELKANFAASADSAKMMVDDRLDKFWNDSRWLAMAGRYFIRRNQLDQAAKVYTRLTQLPYPKLDYFKRLLEVHERNNDLDAVNLLADNLPLRFRGSRIIQETFLDIYTEAGQKDKAAHYATLLYGHSSEYLPYVVQLSGLDAETGKRAEGRRILVKYTDQFPKSAAGQYQLARFDFQNGDLGTVPPLIDRCLAIDSGYAFAMELMGQYLQAKGQDDSSMIWYEKAIRLNWPTPMAYYNLAEYLYSGHIELNRAANLAMAAVRFMGVDPRGYLLTGQIYYDLGIPKTAKLQFIKGIHLFPDNPEFHFYLGKTQVQLQEKDDAKASLTKALELKLASPMKEEAQKLLSGL